MALACPAVESIFARVLAQWRDPVRPLLLWIALFALGLATPITHARAELLLFERTDLRPGLCVAVRIQLTDVAEVSCLPDLPGVLPERLAEAARRVNEQKASLGLLLEQDPDPRLVRMYLVGARSDQAVIAIERIENRPAPDVDRSLALKVREAVEVVRAKAEGDGATPLAAVLEPAPGAQPDNVGTYIERRAPSATAGQERARQVRLLLELGGGLARGTQSRAFGLLALGGRLSQGAYGVELLLGGRLGSELEQRAAVGRVRERAWTLGAALRLNQRMERFTLGGELAFGFDRSQVEGVTASGTPGERNTLRPHVAIGLDVRVWLWRSLALRVAPAVELTRVRERFALDQQVVLDFGHSQVIVPVTLLLELPFSSRSGTDAS